MTDATVITPAPSKPTRRKKRRPARRRPAVTKAAPIPSELAGLTATDCPVECCAKRCVISGKPYCGHPRKGGLQGAETLDPAAFDRIQRARTALAHQVIDKRSD